LYLALYTNINAIKSETLNLSQFFFFNVFRLVSYIINTIVLKYNSLQSLFHSSISNECGRIPLKGIPVPKSVYECRNDNFKDYIFVSCLSLFPLYL